MAQSQSQVVEQGRAHYYPSSPTVPTPPLSAPGPTYPAHAHASHGSVREPEEIAPVASDETRAR